MLAYSPSPTLLPKQPTTEFDAILSVYPDIHSSTLQHRLSCKTQSCISHQHSGTTHPRRLSPECLQAVRQEFSHMLQLGIIHPSASSWASPLHMVPKKSGDWYSCGDYRALNHITVPDRYPVPHIHFTYIAKLYNLFQDRFSYHQFPVKPTSIPKTAITTL